MNSNIVLSVVCFLSLSFLRLQAETEWVPPLSYTLERASAWEDLSGCRRVEYRLLYLLEADKEAKELAARKSLTGDDVRSLRKTIENLDEVLVTYYAETLDCFKRKPNPTLLTMLLYHHKRYVNSAMESWQPIIAELRKLDPEITQKADKLVAANL